MLARSIDPEAFGPTFEEKLFVIGKRICIVSAIAALSISALDLVNANAVTTVAAALRDGRLNIGEMPDRLLAGIHEISIYPDRSTAVVAIPRDSIAGLPKVASLSRPAATLYEPAKPKPAAAPSPAALPKRDEPKVAVAKPAPVAVVKPAASAAPRIKNNPIVAELAAARYEDAVDMAMLPPADSQRPGVFALASLPASMDITATPAVAKEARTVSTVRMILAGLKDRDIAARGQGNTAGISEDEIKRLLQGMVKQRRESIALYEQGNRSELADQEREEIAVIESFLPRQMDEAEIESIVKAVIAEVGATGVKDMGKVMAALRERHAGAMDFSRASAIVKKSLG